MTLDHAINDVAEITLVQMMLTIGLGASIKDVLDVTRNGSLLLRAGIANYVLVPAAAVGLLLLFHSPPMVAVGFLIAAVCPGAPFGPPFTSVAKGNVATAVGLMVVLAGSSALLAPVLLPILIPLASRAQAAPINVAKMIVVLLCAQLLPLCIGIAVRQFRPAFAIRLAQPMRPLSALLNLTTFGMIIASQFRMLVEIRPIAYAGMLALVFAGIAGGWMLGGPGRPDRIAVAISTAVRNVGVAMVIATGSFAGTAAVTAATAFGVFQTLVMALIALTFGRVVRPATPMTARVHV
ncbi:MAG TPA: bile acid:sodium symporter [Tepidisphaeraceae bacterium]|jgi:BASS family bile acid:Na+ symporter